MRHTHRVFEGSARLPPWREREVGYRKCDAEPRRAEESRRDAWLDEQITECRARFDFTLTPEEQADIADDLAHDRDGRTRAATASAQREAAGQLARVTWADIEGRAIVAQVDAWQVIEDAADRCAPADAGGDAGRKLRFYLQALTVQAELGGHDPNGAVADAVFYLLAGDLAAKEVWRRLDEKDGGIGLWVGVLMSQSGAGVDRDAAQTLRRLRKVAWTCLREWVRNAAKPPDDRKTLEHGLECELWREAVAQTRGRTMAGALASALDGDCSALHVGAPEDTSARRAAVDKNVCRLKFTLVGDGGAGEEDAASARSS